MWWIAEPGPAVPVVGKESWVVCIALACRYELLRDSLGPDTRVHEKTSSKAAGN